MSMRVKTVFFGAVLFCFVLCLGLNVPTDAFSDNCGGTYVGNVALNTEADVSNLSGIEIIDGDLVVTNTSLTDLSGLKCLTEVTGTLMIIQNPDLNSIDGLSGLQSVGNLLAIMNNFSLCYVDIDNLVDDVTVGGFTMVRNNLSECGIYEGTVSLNTQADIDMLSGYTKVIGDVVVTNTSFTSLTGLGSITEITGALLVIQNADLNSIDGFLPNLTTVGSLLSFQNNPDLCTSDINDFISGISVGGFTMIKNNKACE